MAMRSGALRAAKGIGKTRFFGAAKKVAKTYVRSGKAAAAAEAMKLMTSDESITGIVKYVSEAASRYKSPVGANGLSLEAPLNRDQSIRGTAVGDITNSASMYMFRPKKKRPTEVGDINYVQKTRAGGDAFTSNANQQAVFDISILDGQPVLNNPATDEKYSNLTIKKCFDDLLLSTGTAPGAVAALKLQQTSIHLKTLTAETTITNNNTSATIVDIYEVVPQHTLSGSTYVSRSAATGYMSPSWCYSVGLSSDTTMLEDTLASASTASSPFDSTTFSRTWKIVKHVKVNLTGSSVHRHRSVYAINKTVSYQEFAQLDTSGGKFAGWNPSLLIIQKGVPASSATICLASSISVTSTMSLSYTGQMTGQSKVIVYDSDS